MCKVDTQDVNEFSSLSQSAETLLVRTLNQEQPNNNNDDADTEYNILLTSSSSQPFSFQISMSIILAIIAILQLALLTAFIIHRSKRVLEFAQPLYVCIHIIAGIIATGACYLFLYITNVGCVIREPLLFLSISLIGSTIAARAWRISTLMSNPLMTSSGREINPDKVPRVEKCRQFILMAISALSGCDYNAISMVSRQRSRSNRRDLDGGGRPLRVKITSGQMIRAILILWFPQILLQILFM